MTIYKRKIKFFTPSSQLRIISIFNVTFIFRVILKFILKIFSFCKFRNKNYTDERWLQISKREIEVKYSAVSLKSFTTNVYDLVIQSRQQYKYLAFSCTNQLLVQMFIIQLYKSVVSTDVYDLDLHVCCQQTCL